MDDLKKGSNGEEFGYNEGEMERNIGERNKKGKIKKSQV